MYSSYFNNNDILNAYKNPRKEDQVVDFWITDEITTSEIVFWKCLEYLSLI